MIKNCKCNNKPCTCNTEIENTRCKVPLIPSVPSISSLYINKVVKSKFFLSRTFEMSEFDSIS